MRTTVRVVFALETLRRHFGLDGITKVNVERKFGSTLTASGETRTHVYTLDVTTEDPRESVAGGTRIAGTMNHPFARAVTTGIIFKRVPPRLLNLPRAAVDPP